MGCNEDIPEINEVYFCNKLAMVDKELKRVHVSISKRVSKHNSQSSKKWLLWNSSIMDKIHDRSKFPQARELEIMEEKMLVLEVSPSWKKNWLSVGNSSFMEE